MLVEINLKPISLIQLFTFLGYVGFHEDAKLGLETMNRMFKIL